MLRQPDEDLSKNGLVLVQFKLKDGTSGKVSAQIDFTNTLTFDGEVLHDAKGAILVHGRWLGLDAGRKDQYENGLKSFVEYLNEEKDVLHPV